MTKEKILEVTHSYIASLDERGVAAKRIDPKRTFGNCSKDELLAHARHLADNVLDLANEPDQYGKLNRHFTAMQMCLSFAGIYSLEELMEHNRPT